MASNGLSRVADWLPLLPAVAQRLLSASDDDDAVAILHVLQSFAGDPGPEELAAALKRAVQRRRGRGEVGLSSDSGARRAIGRAEAWASEAFAGFAG